MGGFFSKFFRSKLGKILHPIESSYYKSRKKQKDAEEEAEQKATDVANRSYQLQLDMFKWQKEQTLKLEEGKETKEAKEAAIAQYELQRKRTGRASTLKTVEIKGRFGDFKSKYEKEHPLSLPDKPVEPEAATPNIGPGLSVREAISKLFQEKGALRASLRPIDPSVKADYSGKVKAWETDVAARKKAYTAKTASEFGKISAFKRKNLGPGRVRRKTLYA